MYVMLSLPMPAGRLVETLHTLQNSKDYQFRQAQFDNLLNFDTASLIILHSRSFYLLDI